MGFILTGDQWREFARKLGEIERQLGQNEYPFNPKDALRALQLIVEGRFSIADDDVPVSLTKSYHVLQVIINYRMTIVKMATRGGYVYRDPQINDKNFPKGKGTGMVQANVGVFTLGRRATIEEVSAHRQLIGLKPIGEEHLIEIGTMHPELLRKCGLIANIDQFWKGPSRERYFSYIRNGAENKKSLDLIEYDDKWGDRWWFAGLCD